MSPHPIYDSVVEDLGWDPLNKYLDVTEVVDQYIEVE